MYGTQAVVRKRNSCQLNSVLVFEWYSSPIARLEAFSLHGPATNAPWNTVIIATINASTPMATVAPKVAGFQL